MKQLQTDHIYSGDVLTEIKKIPSKSCRCCITSPPYYGLRDYGTAIWLGGESGPGARPMHPNWARHARNFCKKNDIPFFFKQWGAWAQMDEVDPTGDAEVYKNGKLRKKPLDYLCINGSGTTSKNANEIAATSVLYKFGKHDAGRLLDGQEHNEYPKKHTT